MATLALSFLSYILRDPQSPTPGANPRRGRIVAQVAAQIGGWRSILIAALALSLATFNEPLGPEWLTSTVVGIYVVTVARLQPHRLFAAWKGEPGPAEPGLTVARLALPSEVPLVGPDSDMLFRGAVVKLTSERGSAAGVVVAERRADQRRAARSSATGTVQRPTDLLRSL